MTTIRACVFDAYGTLFDVHSAVRRHAELVGVHADAVSAMWRTRQLEYTWVRTLMGRYADFWRCTTDALEFALSQHGLQTRGRLQECLLESYRTLTPYPEVHGLLQELQSTGIKTAILSNGTPEMLEAAVHSAGLGDIPLPLLSVESLGIYKPSPPVYQLAVDALGIEARDISFQSSNAWDVAGARAFGFHAVWINRSRQADEYGLRGVVPELTSLAGLTHELP
jgi:2-haloacid dehalogenase